VLVQLEQVVLLDSAQVLELAVLEEPLMLLSDLVIQELVVHFLSQQVRLRIPLLRALAAV